MNDQLKTSKQIAHALGVSTRTVGRWVRAGIIPARKVNGRTSPLTVERKALETITRKGR